jgi:integrase
VQTTVAHPLEEADRLALRPARRKAVEGHRGIYERRLADGLRKFEISYTGSDGRRRWKMVEGGIRAAEKERRAILAARDKGEKVAPNRERFAEIAEAWLARQEPRLRPKTMNLYRTALRVHVLPRLGRRRLHEIDTDAVARLIAEMRAEGKAAWTIKGALTPLSRVLSHAERQGWIASNPVTKLEREERPRVERREMRSLEREEIEALLAAADDRYRSLLATAIFSGLRAGEQRALRWQDVDLDAGVIHVRWQLSRTGERIAPKTKQAIRDVVLMPALTGMLREHKLASPWSRDSDPVFASAKGTPIGYRAITLDVYAHLFAKEEYAERMRSRMEESYGSILSGGERGGEHNADSSGVPVTAAEEREGAQILEIGTRRH